jgi:rRNA-processing protein FCF1
MKIILDTNFLIDMFRFSVNAKSEMAGNELFVLDDVVREVEKLVVTDKKESALANLALKFIEANCKVLKSTQKETDDSLVDYSMDGYVIATHDRVLKGKIKDVGGRIAFIRQKNHVVIE